MSLFKWLFGKGKKEEKDGQEEYFKDDFAPVIKRPATKKAETERTETPTGYVKVDSQSKEEKAEKHHERKHRRTARNVVKPTPRSERIIRPSSETEKIQKSPAKAEKPAAKTEAQKPKSQKGKVVAKAEKKAAPKAEKSYQELREDSPEVKGAVAVQESRDTANGKFDIQRARDGRFFFSLYASNHTVIAYSQLYSSSSGAITGINSVIANSQKAGIEDNTLKNPTPLSCPKWEIYLDKAEQYRFRLYAPNGLCVCHSSHGYATKSGCKGGIESIKRFSAEARVDKSYLK